MMRGKGYIALLLAILMLIGIAGCGTELKDKSGDEPGKKNELQETEENAETREEESTGQEEKTDGQKEDEEVIIPVDESVFTEFITRDGDKLMEGDKEFRFISASVPELLAIESPSWRIPDPFEQEDAIKTIVQMGGRVTRPYVISVKKETDPPDMKRHVMGPGEFDEDFFRAMDKALQLCNKYGVRIIIPLVDFHQWQGGIREYAAFRNRGGNSFWTNPQIIEDFKATIDYVLNRTNVYTGVKYKDDKAILAWETGNELFPSNPAWTRKIAEYIKSIDPNHLVIDGSYGIQDASLEDPNIDIVSNHYYPDERGKDFAERCRKDREKAKGKKAFIVGEFGLTNTDNIRALLDEVIENGTSGALIWSLRQHSKDGGFLYHTEGVREDGVEYRAYNWPGFPFGDGYDETTVLHLLREKAYEIQGLPVPPLPKPEPPTLLPINSAIISWRGSVGASSYDIERAESEDGPWTVIGKDVSDSVPPNTPLFVDFQAVMGDGYYYRVKAKNSAGESDYSNVVKSPGQGED